MKKVILLFLFIFLLFPRAAFANGAGLPPFFLINDKLAVSNPLQVFGVTASSFLIPQDFAVENYVVNKPVKFDIDEEALNGVIPEEVMKNVKFSWDFGDGEKYEGLDTTHTYKKIGSYILILTINIYTEDVSQPTQFVDTFLINIVPTKNYKGLPKAVIKVNGKVTPDFKDPVKNRVDINLNRNVSFDARDSKAPGAPIVEYLWDFGDGTTARSATATHNYHGDYFDTVVMRVKDKNGFISEAFVNLRNTEKPGEGSTGPNYVLIGAISVVVVVIAGALIFFILKRRKD